MKSVSEERSFDPAAYPRQRFADAEWEAFAQQLAAAALPLPDRSSLEALYAHLLGVNAWLNLTRVDGVAAYLQRHVLDSLMLHQLACSRHLSGLCCDLGSGAGYPGLPLALTLPQTQWQLVDSRSRKVQFLRATAGLIDAERVQARAFRAREVATAAPDLYRRCQLVSTRATGNVIAMAREAVDMLCPGGLLVVWQGPSCDSAMLATIKEALIGRGSPWTHLHAHPYQLSAEDPQRVLVSLERRS